MGKKVTVTHVGSDMTSSEVSRLPLNGICVFEFCEVAAGPFCGSLLADMGADVIKVERPQTGDALRQWPPLSNGYSENFASLNRNKRSTVFDLKDPEDQSKLRRLIVNKADVIIENYRPGVMAGNGLGYGTLKLLKPELVYCSISAFGQTGPRSREGGFDLTIQAMAGVMSVTGEPNGASVKCGVPISDFSTGLYAAFAIASVLHSVRETGHGEHIDISMLGATLGVSALQTSEFFGAGCDPRKLGSAHPRNAPYRAFRAADDEFVLAAGNDRLWDKVCDILNRRDLIDDPRFVTTSARAANQDELSKILGDEFMSQPAAYWLDVFAAQGIPCAPINSFGTVLQDEQVAHLGLVQPLDLPSGHRTRTLGSPISLSGRFLPIRLRPPALGEHTLEMQQYGDAPANNTQARSRPQLT